MARRNKNKKRNQALRQSRVHPAITRANALRSALGFKLDRSFVESRRQNSPSPAPQRFVKRTPNYVVTRPNTQQTQPGRQLDVRPVERRVVSTVPQKFIDDAVVCARRHARKEILHALKKTGKGGQKKPRRDQTSETHC